MALTFCGSHTTHSTGHHHPVQERRRALTVFYHQGLKVCRKTFLFLHGVGDFRFRAVKAAYLTNGLIPRVHGHRGRIAPNAIVLEDMRKIVNFILEYTEMNAILLPGRIPGYKRDDIQLLPSTTTKAAVWRLYQQTAATLSLRAVSYSCFCAIWKKFLPQVIVARPMTDLCWTCQQNSTAIIRSANMSEEEKTEVRFKVNKNDILILI